LQGGAGGKTAANFYHSLSLCSDRSHAESWLIRWIASATKHTTHNYY